RDGVGVDSQAIEGERKIGGGRRVGGSASEDNGITRGWGAGGGTVGGRRPERTGGGRPRQRSGLGGGGNGGAGEEREKPISSASSRATEDTKCCREEQRQRFWLWHGRGRRHSGRTAKLPLPDKKINAIDVLIAVRVACVVRGAARRAKANFPLGQI